jgi:osmotically inducible protein OsmC
VPRIVREASVGWDGSLSRGTGVARAGKGAFELPVDLPSRVGDPSGTTSPEELLAAAHAGCYITSLGSELARGGTPADRIELTCAITMDEVDGQGHQIVGSAITARVWASAADDAGLRSAVAAADAGCPFSTLLSRAGAEVDVTATLEGDA